ENLFLLFLQGERNIDAKRLIGSEGDAAFVEERKALGHGLDFIVAGRKVLELVETLLVGDRVHGSPGGRGQEHGGFGNRQPGGIRHLATDRSGWGLRRQSACRASGRAGGSGVAATAVQTPRRKNRGCLPLR